MTKLRARLVAAIAIVGLALSGLALARVLKVRAAGNSKTMTQGQDSKKALGVEPAAPDVIDQAAEPTNSRDRMKRSAKNRRYDKKDKISRRLTNLPSGGGAVRGGETSSPMPMPVAQSDAVVIATVIKAQPYLSENESSMYTEFAVNVEQVFKNDGLPSISVNSTVDVDREAGAMRLRNGRVIRYETGGVGRLPRVGSRYVLFLKRINDGQDISILTGYELRQGHVVPLDGETHVFSPETGQITRKAPFAGVDETTFLNLLRTAVANPNQILMPEGGNRQ
jgi:hypothetical protein